MFAYIWKWMKLFVLDIRRKEFVAIKILSVLYLGGLTSLIPFLTIQARSLGITEAEIGIILSVMPIIGIFIPAIAGMLADKIGNFKIYLSAVLLASSFCGLGLLVVPIARETSDVPQEVPVNLTCWDHRYEITFDRLCPVRDTNLTFLNVTNCFMNCIQNNVSPVLNTQWCAVTSNCTMPGSDGQNETSSSVGTNIFLPATVLQKKDNLTVSLNQEGCMSSNQIDRQCSLHCEASLHRDEICSSNITVQNFNPALTLVTYTAVMLLLRISAAASGPLFEGSVLAIVKEHKGDIGFQRVYLNIGMVIMTPISGLLIDVFSSRSGTTDYSPAVYLFFGLNTLCAFLFLFVNLEFKSPSRKVLRNLKQLLSSFEVDCLLFVSFLTGGGFGFLETFLFWLLEDLGADKTLMGTTITVGAASGIPIMIFSSSIIAKFGHANTISFSLAIFVIRFLGYTVISNPWSAMIFEMMESFTLALIGVTTVSYIASLTTKCTIITLQGLVASAGGVGHGTANLLGGLLIKSYGIDYSFRIMSAVFAVATIMYIVASRFFKKNRENLPIGEGEETEDTSGKVDETGIETVKLE